MFTFVWTYLLPSTGLALLAALLWSQRKARRLAVELAHAQHQIEVLHDLQAEGYDVQKRLSKALELSEERYGYAIQAISKFAPPESAEDCLKWLNSPEAKG